MIRLLTLLLSLIDRFFRKRDRAEVEQQVREAVAQEASKEIKARVEQVEAIERTVDPAYVDSLRGKYDRSRRPK